MAVLRGDASNILSAAKVAEMRRRHLLMAEVPGRGHVAFLVQSGSLADLRDWLASCAKGSA